MKNSLHTQKTLHVRRNFFIELIESKKFSLFLFFLLIYGFAIGQIDGLSISKTGPAEGDPGELVTYTITFNNTSATIASNATVVEQLPAADYFTFVSASDGGVWNSTARTVTWTKSQVPVLGFLSVQEKSVTVIGYLGRTGWVGPKYNLNGYYMPDTLVTFDDSATITNSGFNPVSTTFTTTVREHCGPYISPELQGVVKSSGGSFTIYQYVVSNSGNISDKFTITATEGTGPNQSTGTILREILDENLVGQTGTVASPTWTTPYIAPGGSYVFYVKIYINQSPANRWDYTNINIQSNFSNDPDCSVSSDIKTFILNPKGPAFSFNKIDYPDPIEAGDTLTYRLFIANSGDIANDVVLTENYDDVRVDFISATPAPTSGDNIWDLGAIGTESVQVEIKVLVHNDINDGQTITNNASINYVYGSNNSSSGSKTASAVTEVKSSPDLQITKTANIATALPGDEVEYTIKVKNIGNYTANGVSITDDYDQSYIVINTSSINNGGFADSDNIYWANFGSLTPDEEKVFTYTGTIKDASTFSNIATAVNNTASVTLSPASADINLSNNTASETVLVTLLPDLKITKTGPDPAYFGTDFSYTLTIENIGLTEATTVMAEDELPSGVTFVSASDGGTESAGVVTWNIGTLAVGASVTRTVTVHASCIEEDELTNSASVYTTGNLNEPDFDNNETTFTHEIKDNISPTISCPGNITQTADADVCGAIVTFEATATDNCSAVVTYSQDPGTLFPVGTTTVTATATDPAGNTDVCSFTVTVTDDQAPAVTCPGNITQTADADVCGAIVTFEATATDNCSAVVTYSQDPGTLFPVGTTTVTATATDPAGNTDVCSFTVTVTDDQAPAVTCPGNITQTADADVCGAIVTFEATATDNCSAVVTYSQDPGTLFPVGTTTVTATATDPAGNTDVCSFTVTVTDDQAPAVTCPGNITQTADADVCGAIVTFEATATDNCSAVVTYSQDPGTLFPVGTTTVTATATDPAGNTDVCSFTVTVTDDQAPAVTCPGNITQTADADVCGAIVTFEATATDNCSAVVTYSQDPGTLFPVGTTTVTATATDPAGNTDVCSFTVTVTDDQAPAITCPGNITQTADADVCGAIVTFEATATDNCSAVVTYSQDPGTLFPVGTTTVTATATDPAGNTDVCSFTVTVTDDQAPAITCPGNITQTADADVCGAIVTFEATATDNCSAVVTYSQDPGTLFPVGTTTVTATATDPAGNTDVCSFTVTVTDDQAPAVTCPGNITQTADADVCGAIVTFEATATDNCSAVVTYSQDPGTLFPVGTTTVTATATDPAGNTDVCSFTVTVTDDQAPAVTCPGNITQTADADVCGAIVTFEATATDNCSAVVTYSQDPGTLFPVGTTTVTATATDPAGNTDVCSFTVTVTDDQAPAITCPGNITQTADADVCGAIVTFEATATDNCSAVVTYSQDPGTLFPVGTTTVTATATDPAGNTDVCSFTVTVTDDQAPAVTCPGNITQTADADVCGAIVTFEATATDNCSAVVTYSQDPGTLFPVGTTTVTATATDPAGNTDVCSFTVTVTDDQAPAITCPGNITQTADADVCGAIVTFEATATDNCSAVVTYSQDPGTLFPVGTTTVTATATDPAGNTDVCSFTVTVTDDQAPAVTCPGNITQTADADVCGAIVTFEATATDNCSAVVTYSQDPGTLFPVGTTTVTATATDPAGNTDVCSFTVTVTDDQAPAVTCPGNITQTADADVCGAIVTFEATATDNCSAVVTYSQDPGTLFPVGTTTVTATATDPAGNTDVCSFTVTVTDDQAPAVTCPGNITQTADADVCGAIVTFEATATDNCSAVVTYSQDPGTLFPVGTTTVTATATDPAGNTDVCSFTVTVTDDQAPAVTCPGNITQTADADVCGAIVTFEATATDNCSAVVTYSQDPGTLFPVGTTTVTATATDPAGNTDVCSFTVTVTDDQAPAITCPGNITQTADADVCGAIVTFEATATDNCSAVVTYSQDPGTLFPVGTTTVTATATDPAGNTDVCSFTVTVTDDQNPTASNPEPINVECIGDVPSPDISVVTDADDNCSVNVAFVSDVSDGKSCPETITRTYSVTDAAGNSISVIQTITVKDITAPIAPNAPADVTVQLDSDVPAAVDLTAVDNCDGDITVSPTEVTTPGACANSLEIVRTWTFVDACGNSSSVSQTIRVNDNTPPVPPTAPENLTVQCSGNIPVAEELYAQDNDGNQILGVLTEVVTPGSCVNNYTLFRTWTFTDECGNSASINQTITVNDNIAPELNIPADVSVECDAVPAQPVIGEDITATDNCDNDVEITFSEVRTDGDCDNSYTLTRTWTATDNCGNSSSESQVITVSDTQAPVLAGIPVNASAECDAVPAQPVIGEDITATDNCDNDVEITFSEVRTDGDCDNSYTLTRTWTATDNCGNSSSESQVITVSDTQAPVLAGIPVDASAECDAVPAQPVIGEDITATDNCDNDVEITFSEVRTDGGCDNSYTLTRTWTATDNCGNSSSESQVITVSDTQAPVLAGIPVDASAECDAVPAQPVIGEDITATDNCDNDVEITFSEVRTDGDCDNSYTLTRTWTATDNCGNSSSESQVITVSDTQAPVLAGIPVDASAECDAVPAQPVIGEDITATDNCDNDVEITFSEVRTDGGCDNSYTLTRTWTATDNCGNSSSESQVITVSDTQAPVLAGIPVDASAECDAVPAQPVIGEDITATDNCDNDVEITFSEVRTDGDCDNSYTLTRTWTATDNCGNSSSESQVITVSDTQAPVLAGIPVDASAECDAVPAQPVIGEDITATDNCDNDVEITFSEVRTDGDCDNSYTLTRTWTATDNCGNSSSGSQVITVSDTQAPVLAVPADVIVSNNSEVPEVGSATATDNCDDNVTVEYIGEQRTNGDCDSYTLTRTWTATDNCGNSTTKSQTITVNDESAPVITKNASNKTVECDGNGNTAALSAWLANHGGATVATEGGLTWSNNYSGLSNGCGSTGSATVTFTVSDACGNKAITRATFSIVDNTAPVITAQAENQTVECDGQGNLSALNTWLRNHGGAAATDNCGNISWSNNFNGLSNGCGSTGSATVTFTVSDACGNKAITRATFSIVDNTAPVITAQAENQTVECDGQGNTDDLQAWLDSNGGATATDNCGGVSWSNDFESLTSADCGSTVTVTFIARDDCGNTVTTSATFTIEDTTAPEIISEAVNKTVECDGQGNTDELQAWLESNGDASATDICGAVTWTNDFETLVAGSCGATGTASVTFTATDECGNSTSTVATFTIEDTTSPEISVQAEDQTVECDGNGNTDALNAWLESNGGAVASDVCGTVTWTNDFTALSDDCGATGAATVTFTATDECGNASTTTATFKIEDTTAPVMNCNAISVYLGENGMYDLTAEDIAAIAGNVTDNCTSADAIDVQVSQSTFGCGDSGADGVMVTVTATDLCGNSSECHVAIGVIDTIAPVANCKEVIGQLDNNGIFTLTSEGVNDGSIDNCAIDTMYIDKYQFSCDDLGENEVTLTVVDIHGNESTCTATVVVESGSYDCGGTPIVTEPDELTIVYCRADQASGQLNLFDNDSGFTPDDVTMTVSNLPENVNVNTADGTMTYNGNNSGDTTLTFTYTVCHNVNTNNCSTAEVTIHILVDSDCDGIADDVDIDDDNDGILI